MGDIMAASSAAAAEASSLSELSAKQTQSTATDDDVEVYVSESETATVATLESAAPEATATGSSSLSTDSSGSTITSSSVTAGQGTTITSTGTDSAIAVASDHASDSPYHNPEHTGYPIANKAYHSGPSPGKIAAAVVIPVLFLLALAFAIFFIRRRRRRRNAALLNQNPYLHPMTDRSGPGAAAFAKETGVVKPRGNPQPEAAAPILTSATNNSYFTGLSTPTTPSRASTRTRATSGDSARPGGFYEPPPPAYVKHAPPGSTPTLPQLSFAADPFMDPVSPTTPTDSDHTSPTGAALAALSGRDTAFTATSLSPDNSNNRGVSRGMGSISRPDISRTGTMISVASFNSDTYSDTASLHSARPARMSGAAQVIGSRTSEYAPGWVVTGERNPFADGNK